MNITWPDIFAGFMLMGLTLYAVTGGADFGGGVWDLLARGPRATAQRQLIDTAIAPVWEANHIWLIFVVVLLFTAFPPAFAAATIGLHLPLVLMLLGITLRGAALGPCLCMGQHHHADLARHHPWRSDARCAHEWRQPVCQPRRLAQSLHVGSWRLHLSVIRPRGRSISRRRGTTTGHTH